MNPAQVLAVVLGSGVGVILALTGAGGGSLAVPLLMFSFGMPLTLAAPMSLLAVTVAAAVGAVLGLRQRIVRYRAASLLAGCGLVTAPLGLWAAQRVPNEPLSILFGLLLGYVSLRMLRRRPAVRAQKPECVFDPAVGRLRWTLPCARALTMAGLAAGLLAGSLGVGGGVVLVPALRRFTDLDMKSVTAISLAAIALISGGSVWAAASAGLVQWSLALPFTAGAVAGVAGGRRLCALIGDLDLQRVFGLVCAAVALGLIAKAVTTMMRGS